MRHSVDIYSSSSRVLPGLLTLLKTSKYQKQCKSGHQLGFTITEIAMQIEGLGAHIFERSQRKRRHDRGVQDTKWEGTH